MVINEIAQWAALVFCAVFLVGLTRQLASFMDERPARLADRPAPAIGESLPEELFDHAERAALASLIAASPGQRGLVAFVSQDCGGCDELLDDLDATPPPQDVPLAAVSWVSAPAHQERLRRAFAVVARDPSAGMSKAIGVHTTPFVLSVDPNLVIRAGQPGQSLADIASADGSASPDGFAVTPTANADLSSLQEPATTVRRSHA
jgi:hypothetical protein